VLSAIIEEAGAREGEEPVCLEVKDSSSLVKLDTLSPVAGM
jgi:hypothetical protein